MNEYAVTVAAQGVATVLTVMAETAALAREQAEVEADVIAVRFVRAISFSCTIRDGASKR